MAGIITTTYTNIVKIKFIVHVVCVHAREKPTIVVVKEKFMEITLLQKIGQQEMNDALMKCKIRYLTMNRISDIIISEREGKHSD